MLRIAICDDDKNLCNELDRMVQTYMDINKVDIDVDVYYSALSLKSRMKNVGVYDIIFLDIEMDEVSGIDFGKWLREHEHDELTKIIYISHRNSYALELFRIRPTDFLTKPIKQVDINYNLDKCLELIGIERKNFYYQVEHEKKKITVSEIIYLESSNRHVHLHTIDEAIIFYSKLDEAMLQLDEANFWRVHKSYIVNVMHVVKFDSRRVYLDNGTDLPISQTYREDIRVKQAELMGRRRGM